MDDRGSILNIVDDVWNYCILPLLLPIDKQILRKTCKKFNQLIKYERIKYSEAYFDLMGINMEFKNFLSSPRTRQDSLIIVKGEEYEVEKFIEVCCKLVKSQKITLSELKKWRQPFTSVSIIKDFGPGILNIVNDCPWLCVVKKNYMIPVIRDLISGDDLGIRDINGNNITRFHVMINSNHLNEKEINMLRERYYKSRTTIITLPDQNKYRWRNKYRKYHKELEQLCRSYY